MANRPFVHIEIPAADRQKAAEFYGKAFDWTFEDYGPPMNYTTFRTGNIGGGFPELGDDYKPGDVIVYIGSDDIEADLRRIESLGGKTVMPKMEIPETGWFALFTDPTGNKLALFTPLPGMSPGGPSS
ncbi:MAG TPA: VOC family protein [Anaerolineae bacterium]